MVLQSSTLQISIIQASSSGADPVGRFWVCKREERKTSRRYDSLKRQTIRSCVPLRRQTRQTGRILVLTYRLELCLHVCDEGVAGVADRVEREIRVPWHQRLHVAHFPVLRSPQHLCRDRHPDVVQIGRLRTAPRGTWCVAVFCKILSVGMWMGFVAAYFYKGALADLWRM